MEKIAIFRTGTHTDASGKTRIWTEDDLHTIAAKYNEQTEHEAPVVVGHPKDNAPAFGWVSKLAVDGGILYASLKDLSAEFVDMVKNHRFKKRSIALYPDMLLRHVGFLGAVPPAVKGLADAVFSDRADISVEFEFSENGGENVDEKDKRIADLQRELEAERAASRKKDNAAFCDGLVGKGTLLPAQKDAAVEFMSVMDSVGNFEFSDGAASASDKFKKFLEGLPKAIEFKEQATKQKAEDKKPQSDDCIAGASEESVRVHEKALEYMQADNSLTYISAARKAAAIMGGE
jgi:hypothetical protein